MKIKDIYAKNSLHIQKGFSNCGPVTLLNILSLKGKDSYTEEELAKLSGAVLGVGVSNEIMAKVAKEVGLEVIEEKSEAQLPDLERNLDAGNYVIINYIDAFSGYGHYAVITEHDKEGFYFRDSSLGLLRISKRYLPKWWRGDSGIERWYLAVK